MTPVPGGAARSTIAASAMAPARIMMERAPLTQGHTDHVALGFLGRLADRLGNFARLALAEAGTPLLVADDDKRGKTEVLAALDRLGHTVDADQLVGEFALLFVAVRGALSRPRRRLRVAVQP